MTHMKKKVTRKNTVAVATGPELPNKSDAV